MADMLASSHQEIVYLNGIFVPKDKATISPDDRGYYFADGVYEVIKYYKGRAFCFGEHVDRLKRNLAAIRINNHPDADLEEICHMLIETNGFSGTFAAVYLQITRGSQTRRHQFPDPDVSPNVYATALSMPIPYNELRNGIKVIAREDIRWMRCDIKTIALLPNVLMYQEATEEGAAECFFIRNGVFTEATHSNIMAVRNGILYTHPDSGFVLPGITKKVVFRLCKDLNIAVREEAIQASEMEAYDEFFITGTGNEITPVTRINDLVIRNGKPGICTRKLQHSFFRITYEALAGINIGI